MSDVRRILLSLIFISVHTILLSQNTFIINNILLTGNKKTKDRIILRELNISKGDTISSGQIAKKFIKTQNRILDTGLFTQAKMNITNWNMEGQTADISIDLNENWYIYAYPIFELADRNFNVWWNDQNRSFSRVNYGLRATHYNITGRKDRFKIITQFGYTRKLELEYQNPYLNKKQTIGFGINAFYADNKEIQTSTVGNKQQFFQNENEDVLLKRYRLRGQLDYRPALFWYHQLRFEYHKQEINTDVLGENPYFFRNGETQRNYASIAYQVKWDKRIFQLYPQGGFLLSLDMRKDGIGITDDEDDFIIKIRLEDYFKINKKLLFASQTSYQLHPFQDNFSLLNYRAIGYDESVPHGYELYVIDGKSFFLQQFSLRFNWISKLLNVDRFAPVQTLKMMPVQLYLSANFDMVYVRDDQASLDSPFSNRWIKGWGPGIDLILYNTFLIKVEYSRNDKNEGGIFISTKLGF